MIQQKLPFTFLATIALFFCNQTKAQLTINSATLFIQPGATVSVQGNITSNADIQGAGTVILNGSANQSVDMSGKTIQNLQINNTANATLASNIIVGKSLTFTAGKITLGTNNLTLVDTATTTGQGTGKFLETNSTGQVIKNLTKNVASVEIPVGNGTTYRPAFVTSTGTYSSANVGVRVSALADPSKPPMISDYLLAYWPITQTGITGTLNVTGQYAGAGDISGTASNLKGYFYNGTDWSSTNTTSTTASNQVAAPVVGNGDVYGMDGFIVLKAKVYLQAAYNTSTPGIMNETLRAAGLLPLSDPYRAAPYNTVFTQTNDAATETTTSTVLGPQANPNNDIVDWVFVELRNTAASPGNTVLQSRSALLQRNGNVVDVDGISPVTFNNVAAGNYRIAVRHRNHVSACINVSSMPTLSEKQSVASLLDFTSNTALLYAGTVTNAPVATLATGVYGLWSGNANGDAAVKMTGAFATQNDYLKLLGVLGSSANSINNTYSGQDLNFDGTVKMTGAFATQNDYLKLLGVLGSSSKAITQPTF